MANPQNLKPLTTKKAREIGRKGGIASGKAKKERRLMSQIFAELLSNGLDKDIEKVSPKIIRKGGAAAVSLMKTIAESTEGSKVKTETILTINTEDEKVAAVLAEYGINKPASKN
jgi:hypothetical protein